MPPDLAVVRAALSSVNEQELEALARAIEHAPQIAPGLLAYLAHACDHERARRIGRDFPLREPTEAIPDDELGVTFAAIANLMMHFTTHPNVRVLIEAVGDELASDDLGGGGAARAE